MRYSAKMEVASAMYYLKEELGIPVRYLPRGIDLVTGLMPPEGVLFHMVITNVLSHINKMLLNSVDMYEDIFGVIEEEYEDVFPEEGITFDILTPTLTIRRPE